MGYLLEIHSGSAQAKKRKRKKWELRCTIHIHIHTIRPLGRAGVIAPRSPTYIDTRGRDDVPLDIMSSFSRTRSRKEDASKVVVRARPEWGLLETGILRAREGRRWKTERKKDRAKKGPKYVRIVWF